MGILAKVLIGAMSLGAMGGIWATITGYGARPMRGAAYYRPSVRSASAGHSRGYYYGGKY